MQKTVLRRGDWILFGCVIAAVCLFFAFYRFLFPVSLNGTAQIEINGTLYGTCSLNETKTVTVPAANGGYNRVVFENGAVFVEDADCKDKLCVRQGRISRVGETIVCLPHDMVITVQEGQIADVDYTVGR